MQHYSWKQIVVLGLTVLISYMGVYSLPAYIPQLIYHLGVPEENIGYQVGVANNVMYASAALGTLTAGILPSFMDSKKVFVIMLMLQGTSCILYGLSDSLGYLFITLVPLGFFGGAASVIIKTVISNKCTVSYQAYLLTWTMSGPITISSSFAPSLAGYMSFPAEKYPKLVSAASVFRLYPILLFQLLIGGSLLLLSMVGYYVVNNECLSQEIDPLLPVPEEREIIESNINHVLQNKSCIGSILVKSIFTACDVAYISLVPLWLQAPRINHGREYDSNEVSNILIISGTVTAIANYTILGKINTMFHPKVALSMWTILVVVCATITPILTNISADVPFYVAYVPVNIIFNVCVSAGYTPINLMNQNSVPVAATAMMWCSCHLISRLMEGSLSNAFTSLFAWSTQNNLKFPIDYHFAFFCLAITFLLSFMPTLLIRSNIEQRL